VEIFSTAPFSETSTQVLSSMNTDQVSHPYKTTGKIMVLHILIFTFFDGR
jgi:hypothetical protein